MLVNVIILINFVSLLFYLEGRTVSLAILVWKSGVHSSAEVQPVSIAGSLLLSWWSRTQSSWKWLGGYICEWPAWERWLITRLQNSQSNLKAPHLPYTLSYKMLRYRWKARTVFFQGRSLRMVCVREVRDPLKFVKKNEISSKIDSWSIKFRAKFGLVS